jgi:hypothetical protein
MRKETKSGSYLTKHQHIYNKLLCFYFVCKKVFLSNFIKHLQRFPKQAPGRQTEIDAGLVIDWSPSHFLKSFLIQLWAAILDGNHNCTGNQISFVIDAGLVRLKLILMKAWSD